MSNMWHDWLREKEPLAWYHYFKIDLIARIDTFVYMSTDVHVEYRDKIKISHTVQPERLAAMKDGGWTLNHLCNNICGFKFGSSVRDHHMYICKYEILADFNSAAAKLDHQTAKFILLSNLTGYMVVNICHSAHQYNYTGCRSVLVLDGNLKNRCDVCCASEAGYVEYSSLPGTSKTGFQQSPCATSEFCYYHAPRVSCSTGEKSGVNVHTTTRIVQIIIEARETRSGKYYQVNNDIPPPTPLGSISC